MEETTQHVWCIMVYCFQKGKNATEMQKKIWAVYGESAVTNGICQKWFVKFHAADFSLDNECSTVGQSTVEVDSDQIETLIENNQCYTRWEIDSQHTQNIQINKAIGENEKCVFYFTAKGILTF